LRTTLLLTLLTVTACETSRPDIPPPTQEPVAAPAPAVGPFPVVFPDGPVGTSARRGLAILEATRDSLPAHVGNDLRCTSCHLDQGTRANAMPWTGIQARFPQYNSRAAAVFRLEERINGCLERSMNGTALPLDDPAMRDIVAYFAVLSRGIAVGDSVPGQGLPKPPMAAGDTVHGAAVWLEQCARCHAPDGTGSQLGPPVWGERSYNIGAGMARLRTAAGFIKHNMPFDMPGSLSDTDALDVAAYVVSRPRPDFARKAADWPNGDPPVDAAYPTTAGRREGGGR
jgi:thiosulfate dehydrogenase